jgi:integrase
LILSAARAGEVRYAKWDQIDFGARVWVVPADLAKSRREHRVPLTAATVAILNAVPRVNDYVFAGTKGAMSHSCFQDLLERMGHGDVTPHGFRSTFRDWAGEQTSFAREVAEMALSHAVGDATERAYARGTMFEKRRALAEAWAKFCERPMPTGDVVAIGAGRA